MKDYCFFSCSKEQRIGTNTGVKERMWDACSVHQIHVLPDDV